MKMNNIIDLNFLLKNSILKILCDYQNIEEIYICGGYIRDHIMYGYGGKDIDVFIKCSKKELDALIVHLSKYGKIVYGQYGSPRFYLNDNDSHYIDIVPFYNFIVSSEPVHTINDLLSNFDFTANAIGINIKTGTIYDPVQGITDIKNRVLRAVRLDFPEKYVSNKIPLSAVSVFWFRLLHYQNKLKFEFDKITKEWIIKNAYRIKDLEMFKKYFFKPYISEDINIYINKCLHQ